MIDGVFIQCSYAHSNLTDSGYQNLKFQTSELSVNQTGLTLCQYNTKKDLLKYN